MSDMTVERAKEIIEIHRAHRYYSDDMVREYEKAKGFLEGHASRDPEVAELNGKLEAAWKQVDTFDRGMRKTLAELSAEREAFRKLVEALHHCRNRPHEHNPPPDFIITRCEVIDDALKLYATPGHSPEGKGNYEPRS